MPKQTAADPQRHVRTLRRRSVLLGGLAPALLSATGAGRSAAAQGLAKVTVRMDWIPSGYHAPYFAGIKNGTYKDEGLDVTVQPGNGSGVVAQALGNGNGTFALVDGGTMINLVSKGLQVKAVMGVLERSPLAVVFGANSGIHTPADLVGKRIGAANGEAPLVLFPAFLRAANVDPAKVTIVNADAASKVASLATGKVDGVLWFNFQGVPTLETIGFKAATLNYADYGVNVPGLSLIARTAYLQSNPDIVRKFVRATVQAYEWTRDHPEQAMDIMIAANTTVKLDKTLQTQILVDSLKLLHSSATAGKPTGVMAARDWAQAEDLLVRYVGITKATSPDVYFTNEFVAGT